MLRDSIRSYLQMKLIYRSLRHDLCLRIGTGLAIHFFAENPEWRTIRVSSERELAESGLDYSEVRLQVVSARDCISM